MRSILPLVLATSIIALAGGASAQPAGTTAVCKDGSYSTAASKRGACSGHKGIGQWIGTNAPAAKAEPAAATGSPAGNPRATPNPPVVTKPSISAQVAPQGGGGQVWVNTPSKVYHCQGDRWYGKTKRGSYMTEAAA